MSVRDRMLEPLDLAWVEDLPPLLTKREFAEIFRIQERAVSEWISTGVVHAVRLRAKGSGKVLIPRTELRRLLDEGAA